MKRPNALKKLVDFLEKLESLKIHYALEHNRSDSIMVLVAVPGERWEIEFFPDGHIEVEVFSRSKGVSSGRTAWQSVERMLARNKD